MGRFYENAIMYGLQGRTLEGVPYDDKPLPKGKKREALAPEILFLLTIAARQPDPRDRHDGLKTKCWGDPKTLGSIMHLSESKFHQCRDKLIKSGILIYKKNDGQNKNVYRINLEYLRKFYPDVDFWRNNILKIGAAGTLSEDVLRELQASSSIKCATDGQPQKLRSTEEKLRSAEEKLRSTEKKLRSTESNNNTTINNTHTTEVGDDVDAHYLDGLVGSIAAKLEVSRAKIDREKLAAVR